MLDYANPDHVYTVAAEEQAVLFRRALDPCNIAEAGQVSIAALVDDQSGKIVSRSKLAFDAH